MKAVILILSLPALLSYAPAGDPEPRAGRLPAGCEVVMSPGMRITATTSVGTIAITAVDELTRSYTWDGATRAVEMQPHQARFSGSLGLFYDGTCVHWRDHHGIARCYTKEGQQHFKTIGEAMKWVKEPEQMRLVYRDDGLMVGWYKDLPRKSLNVEVWQILIDGKKPKGLPGSQDDGIVVDTVETETGPLVKAVANNDVKAASAVLAAGADANLKSCVDVPVLLIATRHGAADMVEALLKSRADPNVRDLDTDETPLLCALHRADIVKMLLAAGADVNAASRKQYHPLIGMTPLMCAVVDGREDVVQLLIDRRADVNAKAPNGYTALSLAKEIHTEDHIRLARRLEAAGATK